MLDLHFEARNIDDGEIDVAYLDQVIVDYAASPEAQEVDSGRPRPGHWVGLFLRYYLDFLGSSVAGISQANVREVLFDLFPQHVTMEPEAGPGVVRELRAFWSFLQREYNLPQAAAIVTMLDDTAGVRLQEALENPANYGMAKSMVMNGVRSGLDMKTREGVARAVATYNALQKNGLALPGTPSTVTDKQLRKERSKAQRQARKQNGR